MIAPSQTAATDAITNHYCNQNHFIFDKFSKNPIKTPSSEANFQANLKKYARVKFTTFAFYVKCR